MNKLLSIQDLQVTFSLQKNKLHAVRGVSFDLQEGETVGIVGESGCGKSITAKSIVKLLPSHSAHLSGKILYNGVDLLPFSDKQMQKIRGKEIGMIFQDPMTSLNPTLKIGEQIGENVRRHFPKASRDEVRSRAIELLKLAGIPQPDSRIDDYPHTLSGGMRQRIMIALALASEPKLLIADEPTTALDVTIQAQILALLKEIQEKTKTSIILITHDLSIVAGFCDRVLVMYAGKIVESAAVEDLFRAPQHPYTQRLLQAIPRLDLHKEKPLIPIEGSPPLLTHPLPGCAFAPRCPYAMKMCKLQTPPPFSISKEHQSSCWKHDERAKNG